MYILYKLGYSILTPDAKPFVEFSILREKRFLDPRKMDDLGGKPTIFGNTHIFRSRVTHTNSYFLSIQWS